MCACAVVVECTCVVPVVAVVECGPDLLADISNSQTGRGERTVSAENGVRGDHGTMYLSIESEPVSRRILRVKCLLRAIVQGDRMCTS
jgi:hypothetical protein